MCDGCNEERKDPRVPRELAEKLRQAETQTKAYAGIGRLMSEEEILAEMFRYHPPTERTKPKFQAVNQAAKNFAEVVLANCPGRDRVEVVRLIILAKMLANQCITLEDIPRL